MAYNFDRIINRKGTNSSKWEFKSLKDEAIRDEILHLSVADMDFACAEPIVRAINERIDKEIFGYSSPYTEEYLNSVKSWFSRRFNWSIKSNEIVASPGVVPALATLVRILTSEGEGIIIQRPVYHPFTRVIEANNRNAVDNSLICIEGKYYMDFDDLEKKAQDPNNKALLLCSPHNPVGRVWAEEELNKLINICLSNDLYIISDEIHCDLVRKGVKHIPTASLNDDSRIISCTSASKTFNLAGLQLSNIILRTKELKQKWNSDMSLKNGIDGVGVFGIVATQSGYNECEEWLEEVKVYIDDNLKYIKSFIEENLPKAKFEIPEGTYLAWIDLREYLSSVEELEETMVYKAKISLSEGYIFGEQGSGYERINAACPRDVLKECLERMCKALK